LEIDFYPGISSLVTCLLLVGIGAVCSTGQGIIKAAFFNYDFDSGIIGPVFVVVVVVVVRSHHSM
jgi:hypothetical protein